MNMSNDSTKREKNKYLTLENRGLISLRLRDKTVSLK